MANIISKLRSDFETWSFKYNCYEAVHPWTPHCSDCAIDIGLTVFGEAIKLYTPLYLFSQLAQRKFDYQSFKQTSQSIVRSTTFISANAFFALLFFCSSQYLTGKFYYYAVAYVPAFVASSMAVLIEKPARRSSLAFYVANVASEAYFRICVARGLLRPIKYGQVYIFSLAIATLMMLAKRNGFEDDPLSALIKLIVGPEEAKKRRSRSSRASAGCGFESPQQQQQLDCLKDEFQPCESSHDDSNVDSTINSVKLSEIDDCDATGGLLLRLKRTKNWILKLISSRHRLCPHEHSCLYYSSRAAARALVIGYSAQLTMKLFTKLPQIYANPAQVQLIARDAALLRLGLFLASFAGIFKASNCTLRWTLNESTPSTCLAAGLAAGPSMFIYPSPTVALYVLWKCLESLFHEGVRKGTIKNKDTLLVILYGLATSQLFYSALMNPKHMKKSYMAFLDRISRHKLHMVNRSVLDVFGTEASSGYEDFFPDLHPKFMSPAFLGSIWIWLIEQRVVGKQLSSF